jgi:hypothetical protein
MQLDARLAAEMTATLPGKGESPVKLLVEMLREGEGGWVETYLIWRRKKCRGEERTPFYSALRGCQAQSSPERGSVSLDCA